MASNRKTPYKERVAGEIIEALKAGTAPWVKPWRPGEIITPRNATTETAYRGINTLMLSGTGYSDPRWVTYKQAEGQGWQVRKGERGRTVQYWKWPTDEEKARAAAEGRTDRPRAFYATVFNASQVDGIPLWAASEPGWQASEAAERLLTASGAQLVHDQRDRAFYHPATDQIHLPPHNQFATELAYYETALHELGHWTGHPSRMDRDMSGAFGQESYAREELRAEITSYMLAGKLGLGFDPGNHLAYVDHWIALLERDPQEIFRASADAEKISDYLLSMGQEKAPETANSESTHPEADPVPSQYTVAEVSAPAPVSITSQGDAPEKVYLAVPFTEKDAAKAAGARWDRQQKTWYITGEQDPQAFNRWSLDAGTRAADLESPQSAFATFCREAGLRLTGEPVMDGTLQRTPVEGDRATQRSGAYVGHLDGVPAGYVENFKTGARETWRFEHGPALSAEEKAAQAATVAAQRQARAHEREALQHAAAQRATGLIEGARPITEPTPYMRTKGISVAAGGLTDAAGDRVILPLRDVDGTLWSLQFIDETGEKRFLKNGRKHGCFFVVGEALPQGSTTWIAEGYATAATASAYLQEPVVVAFDAGNLTAVAEALKDRAPERTIGVLADNDAVGWEKGQAAAHAADGLAFKPNFDGRDDSGTRYPVTDWNDLVSRVPDGLGAPVLAAQLESARAAMSSWRDIQAQPDNATLLTLAACYHRLDKDQALAANAELTPVFGFEAAANAYADEQPQLQPAARARLIAGIRQHALSAVAAGEKLPDTPRIDQLVTHETQQSDLEPDF